MQVLWGLLFYPVLVQHPVIRCWKDSIMGQRVHYDFKCVMTAMVPRPSRTLCSRTAAVTYSQVPAILSLISYTLSHHTIDARGVLKPTIHSYDEPNAFEIKSAPLCLKDLSLLTVPLRFESCFCLREQWSMLSLRLIHRSSVIPVHFWFYISAPLETPLRKLDAQ